MRMRHIILSIVILNFIVTGWTLVALPNQVESATTTEFGNSGTPSERVIELKGSSAPFMDSTTYFEVPTSRGHIKSATMKISPASGSTEFAVNPRVDVGLDGDIDWEFDGPGFGDFGNQTGFSNDADQVYAFIPDNSENSVFSFRLPKDSTVTSAELNLSSSVLDKLTIKGREPETGFYAGTLDTTYSYYNAPIKRLWIYCKTSDGWHHDIEVQTYSTTFGWTMLWDYYWFSNPTPLQTTFPGNDITAWKIKFRDYGGHSVYYDYEYDIGGVTPTDPTLNIGYNVGPNEWAHAGVFSSAETVTDFDDEINNFLINNDTWSEDDYGNRYLDVPMIFSTKVAGGIKVTDLVIKYQVDATIDKAPNSYNLATSLNGMIPINTSGKSKEKAKIYVAIYSDTKCKLRLSGIDIEYNGAPTAIEIPDTYALPEDNYDENLINLTQYFTDDYQNSVFLNYEIVSYTNSEYMDVDVYDKYFIGVNAEQDPNSNWFGETAIVVSARDSEGVRTVSNEFIVTITEVNDPPEIGYAIPNINLTTNQTYLGIDLDEEVEIQNIPGYYFTDVDSSNLYYKAIVAPSASNSLAVKIHTGNVLNITAIGEYQLNMPVRVFCADAKSDLNQITNFESDGVFQEFIVNITSLGGYTPPMWNDLPPQLFIHEDNVLYDWLNLRDHVIDLDDIMANLTFSIVTVSNSAYMTITIDPEGVIDILPGANFDGISKITLRVQDDEYNSDTESFTINMIPKNDLPTVNILSPKEREYVSGNAIIRGAAYDIEDTLERIELKIGAGSSDWVVAEGSKYWTYAWDTIAYAPDTPKLVELSVRAYDGQNYSELDIVELIVNNVNIDADNDGYPNTDDMFPNDPSEWADTDLDGHGNNKDMFPNNGSEWADSDGDGRGDNSDLFPFTATEWLDSDGDGYGDNSDAFPFDPTAHSTSTAAGATDKGDEVSIVPYMWFIIVIIIIINVLIFIAYAMSRKKELSLNKKET